MGAGRNKDVNVKLNVSLGADGDRAIKALTETINKASQAAMGLAKAAQQTVSVGGDTYGPPIVGATAVGRGIKAGRDLSILQKLGMGGVSGRMGHIQGYGEALGELGFGRLGGALANAKVAGGLAMGIGAVNAAATAATSIHDRYLNDAQRGRQIFKDVVPFGSWIVNTTEKFEGRTARMQDEDVYSQKRRAELASAGRMAEWNLANMPTMAGQAERYAQLRNASAISLGSFDTRTASGRVQAQEEARLVPVRKQLAAAQREQAAATKERYMAETQLGIAQAKGLELERKRAEAQKRLDQDNTSGERRQKLIREANDANAAVAANAELQISARTAVQGAIVKQAGAQQATGMASAAVTEAQAANIQAKADRSAAAAEAFGLMNPFEREFAVDSLKTAQKYGVDALTPEQKSAAARAAPMTFGALAEQAGAASGAFGELRRVAFDEFGDPQRLRNQAAATRDTAARQELRSQADAAREIERAGTTFGRDVGTAIKVALEAAKREIIQVIQLQKNQ